MEVLIQHIIDKLKGKVPEGTKRSDKWPGIRKLYLSNFPKCAVCGGTKKLEVHHIVPFHLNPSLELEASNLITLCEGWKVSNCHLLVGHLGNFKSFNGAVMSDATMLSTAIRTRP